MVSTCPIRIKSVILGDANIGKTSLVLRYLHKRFNQYSESTIGCAYNNSEIEYNGKTYKLDIWDTAGQERYRGLMPMYYRNADIVFLCVDLSEKDNDKIYNDYRYWKDQISKHNDNENRIIIIVGTKSDIKIDRSESDIREILNEDCYPYLETSSKDDIGINQLFQIAIMRMSLKIKETNDKIVIVDNNYSGSWYSGMFSYCSIL